MFFWIAMQSKHPGLKQEFCLLKKGIRIRIGPWIEHLSSSRSCYPHNKLGYLGVRSLHSIQTTSSLFLSRSLHRSQNFIPSPKVPLIRYSEQKKGKGRGIKAGWSHSSHARNTSFPFPRAIFTIEPFSLPLFPESPFLSLF